MLELFLLSNSFDSTKEGSDKRHAVCRPDLSISWMLPWTNLSYQARAERWLYTN